MSNPAQTFGQTLICTVSTVRAPSADLRMFVNYHLNCGVDRMFLFFDDPADESFEHFSLDERLSCIRCDSNYWAAFQLQDHSTLERRQVCNASLALSLARHAGMDWIIHIDSDELVYTPGGTLKSCLKNVGEDVHAVTFPTLEAVPTLKSRRPTFAEIHWFKVSRSFMPRAESLARILGCRRAFKYGYFRGHTVGKTATKVNSLVTGLGIHVPTPVSVAEFHRVTSVNAFTLHFDCCSMDDWKQKWERRHLGKTIVSEMRELRRQQLDDFVTAYQSGSEVELLREYCTQCIIPAYEKVILLATGLLRLVRLKRKMFTESKLNR